MGKKILVMVMVLGGVGCGELTANRASKKTQGIQNTFLEPKEIRSIAEHGTNDRSISILPDRYSDPRVLDESNRIEIEFPEALDSNAIPEIWLNPPSASAAQVEFSESGSILHIEFEPALEWGVDFQIIVNGLQKTHSETKLRTAFRFSNRPGDVNQDGILDSQDTDGWVLLSSGLIGSSGPALIDLNTDGILLTNDLGLILQFMVSGY